VEKINVTIYDITGSKPNRAGWPVHSSGRSLLNKLIEVLEMPTHDPVGRPIDYQLYHLRDRRPLEDDETPLSAGIRDDDPLYLHLDITARARLSVEV